MNAQWGPTLENRPSLGSFGYEQRNSTNTGWVGVLPAALLAHAATSISVNSQEVINGLDPTTATSLTTRQWVDAQVLSPPSGPAYQKGSLVTTDATLHPFAQTYTIPINKMAFLEARVQVYRTADLLITAAFHFEATFQNIAGTLSIGTADAVPLFTGNPPQLASQPFAGAASFGIAGTAVTVTVQAPDAASYTWTLHLEARPSV